MSIQIAPFVLAAAILGAAGFAFVSSSSSSGRDAESHGETSSPPPRTVAATSDEAMEAFGAPQGDVLPPNHPPIGASSGGSLLPASDDAPAISWKVPAAWQTAQNPNGMRIATYRVAASLPGKEAADVSVARAGGTTDANIERWLGQFDNAGVETRTVKTIRGFKVTIVEVAGTFTGGSMNGPPTPRDGWALLGAIVETPGAPYFFKMTGDAATVHKARASFEVLIDSINPS